MKPGTGKTQIACTLINSNERYVNKAYFFCPVSTKKNLENEILKCDLKVPFEIIGWETLSQSDKLFLRLMKEMPKTKNFLIADESIFIKNGKSKRYIKLMKLQKFSLFRICLNGTPIVQSEWDLYYQMNFLSPKIINMNENEFLTTFFKKIHFKKRGSSEREFYEFSEVNSKYLTSLIAPYLFEADFLFENKEKEELVECNASEKSKERYSKTVSEMINIDSTSDFKIFELFNKLQTIIAADESKNKEVASYVKGKRVIVFCSRIKELEEISKELKEQCFIICGETKMLEREDIIVDFSKKSQPLLITLGCGSYGLNLQFCNEVVFSSISFDYGKIDQAKGRIKRIGQNRDVQYTFFTSNLSFYNVMYENVEKKKSLSEIIKFDFEEIKRKLIDEKENKLENI